MLFISAFFYALAVTAQVNITLTPEDTPAFTRDSTATRPIQGVQIKAANGLCLDVQNVTNGDFRENKVPILLQTCLPSPVPVGQLWDIETNGTHINGLGFSGAILVSQKNQHCIDSNTPGAFDNIKGALFACGGRAVGDGKVSATQTIFYNNKTVVGDSIAFPFTNRGIQAPGPGQQCLSVISQHRVGLVACDGSKPGFAELFTLVKPKFVPHFNVQPGSTTASAKPIITVKPSCSPL